MSFLRPFSLEMEGRKSAKNFAKISPHSSPVSCKDFARISLWGITDINVLDLWWQMSCQTFLWKNRLNSCHREKKLTTIFTIRKEIYHLRLDFTLGAFSRERFLGPKQPECVLEVHRHQQDRHNQLSRIPTATCSCHSHSGTSVSLSLSLSLCAQ